MDELSSKNPAQRIGVGVVGSFTPLFNRCEWRRKKRLPAGILATPLDMRNRGGRLVPYGRDLGAQSACARNVFFDTDAASPFLRACPSLLFNVILFHFHFCFW